MARPLRIELAGGLYHVTARGDRREDIYLDDADRERWLELFGEVCKRFNWVSHGWCQMTNHYHVIVETVGGNLAQGMRHLNGVYTQDFNRRHQRVGHVFQGRYKAILVEKNSYLLELSRYVVLNPVRAHMVAAPEAWHWSSYRAMMGAGAPRWLQTDWLLGQFSSDRPTAIAAYARFVSEGIGQPSLWGQLKGQIFLGSDSFVTSMIGHLAQQTLGEIPRAQRRPIAKPLAHYLAEPDRKQAIANAYTTGDYTMQQIAVAFGVHYSTVSRAVKGKFAGA
jgi:REP element-mobilizing transposase RayT